MNQFDSLTPADQDRIIEMAWEDRTPFEAIRMQFGLTADQVIILLRRELLPAGFRRWRKRTSGRTTKHQQLRNSEVDHFRCARQRNISGNRISKRSWETIGCDQQELAIKKRQPWKTRTGNVVIFYYGYNVAISMTNR
jgi:uncharacterized protein (TIGR03643 family)